jgi:hypothetical protein
VFDFVAVFGKVNQHKLKIDLEIFVFCGEDNQSDLTIVADVLPKSKSIKID